tara:strand:+ start:442 stop:606 length:165 start_codon:yes stop_codon:yes gene_type:complete
MWLTDRLRERSSWNGIIIGGCAVAVICGIIPLATMCLYGAVAWGVYNLWMKEDS